MRAVQPSCMSNNLHIRTPSPTVQLVHVLLKKNRPRTEASAEYLREILEWQLYMYCLVHRPGHHAYGLSVQEAKASSASLLVTPLHACSKIIDIVIIHQAIPLLV